MVDFEMKAPAAVYIFNDHVLHYNSSSPDLKVRLISFSPVIAEELSLSLHYDNLQYAYARPAAQLDETSMQTIMHYLDLMEILMQKESQERRTTIIKLIQSLSSFFYEFHADSLSSQKPFSRTGANSGRQHHGLPGPKGQVAAADLHPLHPADFRPTRLPKPKPFRDVFPSGSGNESAKIQEK